MNTRLLHSWKVSPQEAVQIQERLRPKLRFQCPRSPLKNIAAGDVSYSRKNDLTCAAFLLFTYPDLILLESVSAKGHASFPYIPNLFTFREGPILLKAFSRLKIKPDLILIDGQGIAHPRSMGIAAHIGLILNLPSIGCAKSRLFGTHGELPREQGNAVPLVKGNRTIGMAVRTRDGVKPLYISPGHKMDMPTSVKIILSLCRGYRSPEPLRQAHILVNHLRAIEESSG